MVGRLQEDEAPIDQEIVNELIVLTPEWWHSFVLEVTYSAEHGVDKYTHVISSLEGHKEPVFPSDKLYACTYDLGILFREYGKHWRRVRYEIHRENDQSWKYTVSFEY